MYEDLEIQELTDAIVRLTSSVICGTDLRMIRGTLAGMQPSTILGHKGVGVVEEIGGTGSGDVRIAGRLEAGRLSGQKLTSDRE
jgi:D-arabinose 1-dehydrogenase-like Zn-dependent alcohol dehydrogenase